jgi:ATP-dependent DNA helicase RecG
LSQPDLFLDFRVQVRFGALIERLLNVKPECEWCEFKLNNSDPKMVGETISALSNGARLHDEEAAYLVWGVEDVNKEVVGTTFDPGQKVQGQPFEFWLSQRLKPAPKLNFHQTSFQRKRLVILEIGAATDLPVAFDRIPRIRIGSATPPLRDYPEIEKALLSKLRPFLWEQGKLIADVTAGEVIELLDVDAFFQLRRLPRSTETQGVLGRLTSAGMIKASAVSGWDITNLGGIMLARDLRNFSDIERKSLRLIHYTGVNRLEAKPEQSWTQGYAAGFTNVLRFLEGILPAQEVIGAKRTADRVYPSEAIKELLVDKI